MASNEEGTQVKGCGEGGGGIWLADGSPPWNAIIINKAPFTHNSCTMNEYLLSSLLAVAGIVIVSCVGVFVSM